MAYALVGSVGPGVGPAGSASPTWGTGATRTAGNLLVCWVYQDSSTAAPTLSAGWSAAKSLLSSTQFSGIYYKVAAGGDAAPVVTAGTGGNAAACLAEFSGNDQSSPPDQSGSASGSTSPLVAAGATADVASGELVLSSAGMIYTAAATKTITDTYNNGATATNAQNNDATSVSSHYHFSYGITTSKAAATQDSMAYTITKISLATLVVATMKLPAVAVPGPPLKVVNQAVNRASVWCLGLPERWKRRRNGLLIPQAI